MKSGSNIFIEYIGWCGALAMMSAYGLYAFGILGAESIWYHLLNLFGAVGIVLVSFHKKAFQPAVLNIMWAGIALYALYVYL